MPRFYLVSEFGRREALRYAAGPACSPDLVDRIRQLVDQARAADANGDWRLCLRLTEALRDDAPTPAEIEARKIELRALWPEQLTIQSRRRKQ